MSRRVNPSATGKPVIIWRNPTIGYRRAGARAAAASPRADRSPAVRPPRPDRGSRCRCRRRCRRAAAERRAASDRPPVPSVPLRTPSAKRPRRSSASARAPTAPPIGPDDFASEAPVSFEVPLPQGISAFDLQVDAAIGADRDQVFRITITRPRRRRARGIPDARACGRSAERRLPEVQGGRPGVRHASAAELAITSPRPPTKTRSPMPFDSTYNVAGARRVRQRREICPRRPVHLREHARRRHPRKRLDHAWNDLYASFAYHDNYLSCSPSTTSST